MRWFAAASGPRAAPLPPREINPYGWRGNLAVPSEQAGRACGLGVTFDLGVELRRVEFLEPRAKPRQLISGQFGDRFLDVLNGRHGQRIAQPQPRSTPPDARPPSACARSSPRSSGTRRRI